jgi:hypothetical protein
MAWKWRKTVPSAIIGKVSDAFYLDDEGDAIVPIVTLVEGILVDIRNPAVVTKLTLLQEAKKSDEELLQTFKVFTHIDEDDCLVPILMPSLDSVWLMGGSIPQIKKKMGNQKKITTIMVNTDCNSGIGALLTKIVANVLYEESVQPKRYLQYFAVQDMHLVECAYQNNSNR